MLSTCLETIKKAKDTPLADNLSCVLIIGLYNFFLIQEVEHLANHFKLGYLAERI